MKRNIKMKNKRRASMKIFLKATAYQTILKNYKISSIEECLKCSKCSNRQHLLQHKYIKLNNKPIKELRLVCLINNHKTNQFQIINKWKKVLKTLQYNHLTQILILKRQIKKKKSGNALAFGTT